VLFRNSSRLPLLLHAYQVDDALQHAYQHGCFMRAGTRIPLGVILYIVGHPSGYKGFVYVL